MAKLWTIVGGADKGGVIVREGRQLNSLALPDRLTTGAEVEELELAGERLHFRRRTGSGPDEGWISIKASGKALAEPLEPQAGKELPLAAEPATATNGGANGVTTNGEAKTNGHAEALWIQQSRRKMEAFRAGEQVLPPQMQAHPKRLEPFIKAGKHPRDALPPFKRLTPKMVEEMSVQNLPGHWSGLKFPHNAKQLLSFGPQWYTDAFHKFGTLPEDNRVTKVVHVEELPLSGFDAAGGGAKKAFVTLEYAKPDPSLHTQLFAKFPFDYFGPPTEKAYRMQISTYSDIDSAELLTSLCCEHLMPFPIPKLYFCDINRDTTNYVLIVERIQFGRRGKVENGKVVEKIERKPFEVLPVCGKYQDYLLEDPAKIYYCIFREMAHLAAWDHQGRFETYFGPLQRYTPEEFLKAQPRKPLKMKAKEVRCSSTKLIIEQAENFALNVAPQIFTPAGRDPQMLKKMKEDVLAIAPYFDDIRAFISSSSDYVAAMHMNLQADNAYFWADEQGDLDCGVFDWCGFTRSPFVGNFMGCLSGADAEILDAHEEGLMRIFADEYKRYGGPAIDWKDLLLRYRLMWPSFLADACQWVERDIYRDCPKEEWPTIKTKMDDKFVNRWNVRCRGTTVVNTFEFWPRRNFRAIVEEWAAGIGKPFVTEYT